MSIYLETQRLYLRNFKESDRDFIKRLDSDPDVVRHISNGIPSDDKEVDRAMGVFLTYQKNYHNKYGYWLATLKETDQTIGWFHLRPLKSDPENTKELELGYRLLKSAWGKGFATEICQKLIEKAWDLGANNVWAHAMKANMGSIKVMEKCGLKFDREDRYEEYPGEDKACVWYVLNKS